MHSSYDLSVSPTLIHACYMRVEETLIETLTCSGGSSVGQNKLLQLILGYIYILKHLQSNFIGKILFFGNS